MSYASRSLPPRPYGSRPIVTGRPVAVAPVVPVRGGYGAGAGAGAGALGGALGAIGGTLGCLLCLAAIGALGLFTCLIAITSYARQFLQVFKARTGQSNNGADQMQIAFIVLFASLFYTIVCRMQRS